MSAQMTPEDSMHACAAALAALPKIGPARLSRLLRDADPVTAWAKLREGHLPFDHSDFDMRDVPIPRDLLNLWKEAARNTDPNELLLRYKRQNVKILTRYTEYPNRLTLDEYAPSVLFALGDLDLLHLPTVGIVGTRRCSRPGRQIAEHFGRQIANVGIAVVSGLAAGIDGAAHRGVLEAPFGVGPIGVVGSGLDMPYPAHHTELWRDVATKGLLLSETPLGQRPHGWRFPARNRIIAALSDVLVVGESHERGGSLITVDEAIARNVLVMAIPGSILQSSSVGSNNLLRDGVPPACSPQDVIDEVRCASAARIAMLEHHVTDADADRTQVESSASHQSTSVFHAQLSPKPMNDAERTVAAALSSEPITMDELLMRSGMSLGELSVTLRRLEAHGCVMQDEGWWWLVREQS